MSTLNLKNIQLGDNPDPSKNFVLSVPAVADGTLSIKRQDGTNVLSIDATGKAVIPGVVGTVAQVGGIPTGQVVERGSNANGQYVRFADGTQICTAAVSITIANAVAEQLIALTFPATFSSNPAHAISFDNVHITQGRILAANSSIGVGNMGLSGASYAYRQNISGLTTLTQGIRYLAVGRWF